MMTPNALSNCSVVSWLMRSDPISDPAITGMSTEMTFLKS